MTVKFVNLTPHPITIMGEDRRVKITFEPCGLVARTIGTMGVYAASVAEGITIEVPVKRIIEEDIVDLPDPCEGIVYIASAFVAQLARRPDVMSPDTSHAFRDPKNRGELLGVRNLRSWA